jgi:NADH:ubiquinone reductase (H+-translocating)
MRSEQGSSARSARKRVVILGGGFGGAYTAMGLEKLRGRQDDFEITLVNRENYFVYQPLLAEVVSGSIGIVDMVSPLRRLLNHTEIQVRSVEAVDLQNRVVTTSPGFKPVAHQIPYDHLVLALGNVPDFRQIPGLTQHALPFKYLGDALHLRNHAIHVLEEAGMESDPALKQALLTFVVVGGGFAGVECAAELNDFLRRAARTYRNIDPGEIRVVLLEIFDRILPDLRKELGRRAEKVLSRKGVEIRLNTRITAATSDTVILEEKRGEEWVDIPPIATKTLVSTVPSGPNPIIEGLDLPKHERSKRIKVDLRMQVEGSDHVWALGDCALIPAPGGKGFCPPTAQYAVREAQIASHNIVAAIRGTEPKEFAFKGLGKMGALGHHSAVGEIMGVPISGLGAWMMWRSLYLMLLPGWDRQVRTGLSWLAEMLLPAEIVQLQTGHGQGIVQEHYEPGQIVFHQNDLGDRFYIILAGRCEVIRTENGIERKLCELGPKEYFGELALLNQTTRTATIRAIEPLDLLSIPKPEFGALVTQLPALRESFEEAGERRRTS